MFNSKSINKSAVVEQLVNELSKLIANQFNTTIQNRSAFFNSNPDKIPYAMDKDRIITSYKNKNTVIAGAANAILGIGGAIAAIPEMGLMFSNYLNMVYDIGKAYGKDNLFTRELLGGIMQEAYGINCSNLLRIQGEKVYVQKSTTASDWQGIIIGIVKVVATEVAEGFVAKFIPFVGAAFLAVYAGTKTKKIGDKAVEICTKEIIIEAGLDEETNERDLLKRFEELEKDFGN